MGKQIKIKLDLNTIIEFELSEKEKLELIDHILYSCLSEKGLNKFTKKFITEFSDCEAETKNRSKVILACNTIKESIDQ